MPHRRLLSVDPSLTCSGWASFELRTGKLLDVGKIKGAPPRVDMASRLTDLHRQIVELLDRLDLGADDHLVCEAPTTMRDPRAALCVEQVRCTFETLARHRNVTVPGRINPRSVHNELLGLRGAQLSRPVVKSAALQVAALLYGKDLERLGVPVQPRNQDVIDAVLIGSLGVAWVQSSMTAGVPTNAVFDGAFRKQPGRGLRM